jgi:uncharacterized protein with PIN domain
MHGFVNLFVAGILAYGKGLDASVLAAVLADERPAAFQFDELALAWGQHSVSASAVAATRAHALISYGCCSFDEPRDDLRALGLL